jgi:hypothetical protein
LPFYCGSQLVWGGGGFEYKPSVNRHGRSAHDTDINGSVRILAYVDFVPFHFSCRFGSFTQDFPSLGAVAATSGEEELHAYNILPH